MAADGADATVGFIGLGIMGQGMARRLLGAGKRLHVWNRSGESAAALASESDAVTVEASPAAVISACRRTYLMLSTPEVCEAVYTMDGGVLAGVSEGKQLVDCATLRPEDMASLAERVVARGGKFIEAPVSGSKAPAAQGSLIFMAAGDEATYKDAADDLGAMGKASVFCGAEVGAASRMKLVVNMVMGTQLAAIAEGLALASELGLDGGDLQKVLDGGAMASPMMALKGPLMAAGNYPTAFPLKHALKDMRFALGIKGALPLPVSDAATASYTAAEDASLGDADFCAVMEVAKGAVRPKL